LKIKPKNSQSKYKKIFIVGFPKSGTSTITRALNSSGLPSAHWKIESQQYVGALIYRGFQQYNDPWYFFSKYSAITQADVCLPSEGLNYWPNLDFVVIKAIEDMYPECLFLLNYRDPIKIVSSIKRWSDLQQRLKESEIIGLPKNIGSDSELKQWIEAHFEKVRNYFLNKENFLEIDISKDSAPILLANKLGVSIKWWGIANQNSLKDV
jgi:protein O-GlcNAc transferase